MSRVQAVISDFGGVLTTPLLNAFAAMQDSHGIQLEALGKAMHQATEAADGANPLYELEKGAISEAEFLRRIGVGLEAVLGHAIDLHGYGEGFFSHLHPNDELFAYMRSLRERGLRMAILTNNVREWEPLWRPMLPIDEIFELVVDSAFVEMRKPDPRIYELTLERLGVAADAAVFVDDIEVNCEAARAVGMQAVWFRSNEQAIADLEAAIADPVGA
jgi:epoxide hydrolase-like predicted phosphatase